MKHTVITQLVWFSAIVLCAAAISCSRSDPKYYWVMSEPCPDSGVRIWYPAELADHKDCGEERNVSRALALAIVLNIIQDVDHHKIHYHIRKEDRGFVLTEYLADPKSRTGERPLGRDEPVHYHGVYVDLDTPVRLIGAVKAHQHGAE
jgi:hypothetical protein